MFSNKLYKPKTVPNRDPSTMKDEKVTKPVTDIKFNQNLIVTDGPQGSSNQKIEYFCFKLQARFD